MKKLTENQQIILNEEMRRAMLLKKAKKSLNEKQYKHFTSELVLLEEKADRYGIPRIELYEGFFDKLKQAGSGLMDIGTGLIGGLAGKAQNFSDRNMTAKDIEKELQSILQDRDTQILFDKVKNPESYMKDGSFTSQDINAAKVQAEFVLRNIRILFNRLGALDPNLKAQDSAESLAKIAKILGMDPKELLAMYGKGAKQAQQQAAQPKMDPETAAYVKARSHSAKAARDGGSGDGGAPEQRYRVEIKEDGTVELFLQHHKGDGLGSRKTPKLDFGDEMPEDGSNASENIGLVHLFLSQYREALEAGNLVNTAEGVRTVLQRIENAGNGEVIVARAAGGGSGEGTPEGAPEGDSGEGAKVITVRSVQRPIINLIQRVSAAQGVDVSVKQAQEIAITITKNLVNQMRANGVEFKGVSKDLKEILVKDIEYQLSEARLARDWMQKNMKSQSKTGSKNTGVKIGSQWIATAEELFQKIKVNGLDTVDGFQDNMEEMKKEPNNYVDFLDIAQDLKQLMPRAVVSAAHSGARRRRDEFMELKNSLDTTLNLYKQFKIISIKEDGKKPSKFGNIAKIALTREARKKYAELKRQVGTVDSKKKGTKLGQDKERIAGEKARGEDKAAEKDMSMANPEAGKINISQTVGKAIQNGGLDQDVAKKITPILKDKIRKIIAKHMDKDVRYLEEKVDRYVKAVIREVK